MIGYEDDQTRCPSVRLQRHVAYGLCTPTTSRIYRRAEGSQAASADKPGRKNGTFSQLLKICFSV